MPPFFEDFRGNDKKPVVKVGVLLYNPVLNSFESVKMSQTLYLKALGLFFVRP